MKKSHLIIVVLVVAAIFLFGCTAQQKSQNNGSLGASETLKQQQQYEAQINSMTSELNDMNSIINDPELDRINFVQLDENAFK